MSFNTQQASGRRSSFRTAISFVSRLKKDRSASVAIMFAASMTAVVPAVGVAVDVGRMVQFKSAMQNAADNAALAGAATFVQQQGAQSASNSTATNFMTRALGTMSATVKDPKHDALAVQIQPLTSASGTVGYTVQVSATRSMGTTFLSPVMPTITVSASATAKVPLYNKVTIGLSGSGLNTGPLVASSDAGDNNIIYMYAIPVDNSVPKQSDLVMLYNNDPAQKNNNPTSATLQVQANQNIGFALMNKTGALSYYGPNGYGGQKNSVHWMYSHLQPPSKQAYPSVTQNCLIETSDISKNPTSTAAAPNTGSCFSTTPGKYTQNLQLDCTKNAGKVIRYYWNDMGGQKDDHDYNDMAYSVQCPKQAVISNQNPDGGNGAVVLIK